MEKLKKNTLFQIAVGVSLWWLFFSGKKKPVIVLDVGLPEPETVEYESQFFKDSEYFKDSPKPLEYTANWLRLVRKLDEIRLAFGAPILIRKGYTIQESPFNMCKAVEIYPQNNNVSHLKDVIKAMQPRGLNVEYLANKNIYLELI